jgi:hypothetical protein
MAAKAPPIPEQWPAEVSEHYTPVRTLGVGGFASVMLAKKKKPATTDHQDVYCNFKWCWKKN